MARFRVLSRTMNTPWCDTRHMLCGRWCFARATTRTYYVIMTHRHHNHPAPTTLAPNSPSTSINAPNLHFY